MNQEIACIQKWNHRSGSLVEIKLMHSNIAHKRFQFIHISFKIADEYPTMCPVLAVTSFPLLLPLDVLICDILSNSLNVF